MSSEDILEVLAREVEACLAEISARKAALAKFCENHRHELEKHDFKVDAYSSLMLEIDFYTNQELSQTIQACHKLLSVLERAEKRIQKSAIKIQRKPSRT